MNPIRNSIVKITDLQNEIPNIKVHLCRGWAIKRSWKRYFSRSLHLKKNQNWNSMGHFHMIIVLTTLPSLSFMDSCLILLLFPKVESEGLAINILEKWLGIIWENGSSLRKWIHFFRYKIILIKVLRSLNKCNFLPI